MFSRKTKTRQEAQVVPPSAQPPVVASLLGKLTNRVKQLFSARDRTISLKKVILGGPIKEQAIRSKMAAVLATVVPANLRKELQRFDAEDMAGRTIDQHVSCIKWVETRSFMCRELTVQSFWQASAMTALAQKSNLTTAETARSIITTCSGVTDKAVEQIIGKNDTHGFPHLFQLLDFSVELVAKTVAISRPITFLVDD